MEKSQEEKKEKNVSFSTSDLGYSSQASMPQRRRPPRRNSVVFPKGFFGGIGVNSQGNDMSDSKGGTQMPVTPESKSDFKEDEKGVGVKEGMEKFKSPLNKKRKPQEESEPKESKAIKITPSPSKNKKPSI